MELYEQRPPGGRRITVFAGATLGKDPTYQQAAQELGTLLGRAGLDLIFGGTRGGLMQVVADAVKAEGGNVIGVRPNGAWPELFYPCEQPWQDEVDSLSRRKIVMLSHADAVMILPGGLGSLDELSEVLELLHLGEREIPVGLLNTADFYLSLLAHLDHLHRQGFARVHPRTYLLVEHDPTLLLQRILAHPRWLSCSGEQRREP